MKYVLRSPWVHVILFALYPVLFLYATNIDETRASIIVLPAAALVIFAVLLTLLNRLVFKSFERAGVATTLFFAVTFSYGHVVRILPAIRNKHIVLVVLWIAVLCIGLFFLFKRRNKPIALTRWFNTTAWILVGLSLAQIGLYILQNHPAAQALNDRITTPARAGSVKDLPDVYYLIFDRYGSVDALQNTYGFDNSAAVAELEESGFLVNNASTANYLDTSHSLAATLNLAYLQDMPGFPNERSGGWQWMYNNIEDNAVLATFKNAGYTTLNLGSWWGATRRNENADFVLDNTYTTDFSILLYATTLFSPITETAGLDVDFLRKLDIRMEHYNRFNRQMDALVSVPKIAAPTYTFAHILMPHTPYVFYADGSFRDRDAFLRDGVIASFTEQMQYLNKRIPGLLDTLLRQNSDGKKPIVIIQADEGPYPVQFQLDEAHTENLEWAGVSDKELHAKLGIMNAWYVPEEYGGPITPPATSVNTFRTLFNTLFDTSYELLPDRAYLHEANRTPYRLRDITNLMSAPSAGGE